MFYTPRSILVLYSITDCDMLIKSSSIYKIALNYSIIELLQLQVGA